MSYYEFSGKEMKEITNLEYRDNKNPSFYSMHAGLPFYGAQNFPVAVKFSKNCKRFSIVCPKSNVLILGEDIGGVNIIHSLAMAMRQFDDGEIVSHLENLEQV